MDGDGSIQVNHWRYKILQYRLVIKLKNCPENIAMLNLIKQYIGGNIKLVQKDKFVIWVVNDKKQIRRIIRIFDKYPPLTLRLRSQLTFMLECFKQENVDLYFKTRNKKYLQHKIKEIKFYKSYFNEWLSGFIEAEGCFSIRSKNNIHSFSIGQNNDKYILDFIKNHFCIFNEVRNKKDKFWFIEVYRKSILLNIIDHCNKYPLLGEKLVSFNKFKDLFK
uniref:LAGLIDADG homing endonuclease n=1 Tax=Fuscoporia gilva TaxID=40471 RepID=UPI0023D7C9BB|nr:LAGLIDADG homing endonuclease [Fuscoporia gilva]WDD39632.1 LAGLIDADG homing endonuclease [Fuscoporia gilva]